MIDLTQLNVEIIEDAGRMRKAEQRRVRGSFDKIHKVTGWEPNITISESLEDILQYWRNRI